MNNAKKKLLGGTIVYFIGNALISIIQFFMLPLITGKLSPEEYGYFDLIVATGNLIMPIVTLQITDAVFTFFFNSNEDDRKRYFTSATMIILIGICFLTVGTVIMNFLIKPINQCFLVSLFYISNIILLLYTKMARSLDKNIEYVKCNLLKSVLYIIFQIVFLLIFKMKIESLFLSNIISIVICIAMLEAKLKLRKYIVVSSVNKQTFKEMVKFSMPLIPNSFMWWMISSVNTYIVSYSLGFNVNGIYSVANKFSVILTMITSVFLLAWQESTIREYKKDVDDNGFYNEVAYQFINLVFSVVVLLIPLMKIVIPYMINEAYYSSIPYSPILLLAAGMGALTGFYGSLYAATRKTIGSMNTTILGVITNLAIVLLFINKIGLYAPALATFFSNLIIVIARHVAFRKTMNIHIKWKYVIILALEIGITLTVFYLGNLISQIIVLTCCIVISLYVNQDIIKEIIKFIAATINRKREHNTNE